MSHGRVCQEQMSVHLLRRIRSHVPSFEYMSGVRGGALRFEGKRLHAFSCRHDLETPYQFRSTLAKEKDTHTQPNNNGRTSGGGTNPKRETFQT
jgi:hypothetical protein